MSFDFAKAAVDDAVEAERMRMDEERGAIYAAMIDLATVLDVVGARAEASRLRLLADRVQMLGRS